MAIQGTGKLLNEAAKVLATCLSNRQKPLLLLTSFGTKILDNWQSQHQKFKKRHAKEVINCTRPTFKQAKSDPGGVLCTVLVAIPSVGPPKSF